MIHISHNDHEKKILTVANMWKLPVGSSIGDFISEVKTTAKILQHPTHGIKRKRDEFDETLQGLLPHGNKKIHTAFGQVTALDEA